MVKVVWVAGMPRSGSMWTFNVVRELARHSGFKVLPEKVFVHEADWLDYANREAMGNRDPKTFFVLKTHDLLQTLPRDHLIITNIRDIRDTVMSFMRFMCVDFERALKANAAQSALADHYLALPEARRMVVRYEEIKKDPITLIKHLADRLELASDEVSVSAIASDLSKEKIKTQIQDQDQRCRDALSKGHLPTSEIMLPRSDGQHASINLSTGFQSGHVSDYQDGDWRHLLSEDQIATMSKAFAPWLSRHGFSD